MTKIKKVAYDIASDRKMQCFAAINVDVWFGPVAAVIAVVLAEMIYIAVDVFTTPIVKVRERLKRSKK